MTARGLPTSRVANYPCNGGKYESFESMLHRDLLVIPMVGFEETIKAITESFALCFQILQTHTHTHTQLQ